MTALGTGVLVGTALIVIIPEGVETLYRASEGAHNHRTRSLEFAVRDVVVLGPVVSNVEMQGSFPRDGGFIYDPDVSGRTGPDDGYPGTNEDGEGDVLHPIVGSPSHDSGLASDPKSGKDESAHRDPHVWVGVSLIAGFILMYLIDTLPEQASTSMSQQPQRFPISLNSFSFNRLRSFSNPIIEDESLDDHENASGGGRSIDKSSRPSSTTLGLVIHAAADGIALGASSAASGGSGKRNLSLIIFIALMLHKAPAAFGLTSVLLKQGLSKRMARAHLVVFSLAAPVGALLTWSAVHILGFAGSADSTEGEFICGLLLLFSGGTFLYVAVHTMQESSKPGGRHSHDGENGYASVENPYAPSSAQGINSKSQSNSDGMLSVLVTVGGMLLPLLTQWGHAH
jgi:zinc transporter 9